jgi:hypothetical protein
MTSCFHVEVGRTPCLHAEVGRLRCQAPLYRFMSCEPRHSGLAPSACWSSTVVPAERLTRGCALHAAPAPQSLLPDIITSPRWRCSGESATSTQICATWRLPRPQLTVLSFLAENDSTVLLPSVFCPQLPWLRNCPGRWRGSCSAALDCGSPKLRRRGSSDIDTSYPLHVFYAESSGDGLAVPGRFRSHHQDINAPWGAQTT